MVELDYAPCSSSTKHQGKPLPGCTVELIDYPIYNGTTLVGDS